MRIGPISILSVLILSLWLGANPAIAQSSAQPALVASAAAPAASADKQLPSTDEILEHYRTATGGREVWSKFTTRSTKGIYQTEDLSGFAGIEIINKAPNLSYTKTTFSNGNSILEICDGKSAWLEDPAGNKANITGAALESRLHSAVFDNRADFLAKSGPGSVLGTAKVGAHTAYVVSFTPDKKTTSKVYFDTDTGLVVRVDDIFHRDDGDYTVETDVDDYRPVDGAYFPFKIRHTEHGNIYTIRVTQIRNNVPVDDTLFAK